MQTQTNQERIAEIMGYARAIFDGLNWDAEFQNSEVCVQSAAELDVRINVAWEYYTGANNGTKENLYEFLLALGNISTSYKSCWDKTEAALVEGITWIS